MKTTAPRNRTIEQSNNLNNRTIEQSEQSNNRTIEQSNNGIPDPWAWINTRICAPQRHIHLDGEKSVELLPFYWAALKADPHDVEAWTTAIFIASDHLKDDSLVQRLVAEAKETNPRSAEIAFAEGRYLRKNGQGDLVSARKCFERAEQLLNQKGIENWTEDDQVLNKLIRTFLNSAK